jgi:apolipoprotein N-acyltransferase
VKKLRALWPWLASAAGGTLLALALPPFDQAWLCWIALIPLICAVWFGPRPARRPGRRAFALGFVFGLFFFVIAFSWLTNVTVGGWVLVSFYFALYPACWAIFLAWINPRDRPSPIPDSAFLISSNNLRVTVAASAAWVGLEWIRSVLFTGWGWNNLGTALHEQTALIQIADITGVGGVSFLVMAANVMAVLTVRRLTLEVGRTRLRPHYDFTLTVALLAAAFAYGVHHYYTPAPGEKVAVKIAAVQPNIPQDQKWDEDFEQHILDTYQRLTDVAILGQPNLLIWPEAATPRPLLLDEDMKAMATGIVEKFHGDFLVGTIHYDHAGAYNSAVALAPSGAVQLYYKIHLVPFGEYVPFRHSFPLFAWIVGDLVPSDFTAGTEPVVFTLRTWPIKVAPLICFEDTVGDLTRQFAIRGAELLVTITNDGWFRESAGSRQHLINSVFRAVETKLPLVRAANTGVTCFIDRLGRVTSILADPETGSTFIEGVLTGEINVPVEPPLTFYSRYGELFSILCLVGTILSLRTRLVRHRKPLARLLPSDPPASVR